MLQRTFFNRSVCLIMSVCVCVCVYMGYLLGYIQVHVFFLHTSRCSEDLVLSPAIILVVPLQSKQFGETPMLHTVTLNRVSLLRQQHCILGVCDMSCLSALCTWISLYRYPAEMAFTQVEIKCRATQQIGHDTFWSLVIEQDSGWHFGW